MKHIPAVILCYLVSKVFSQHSGETPRVSPNATTTLSRHQHEAEGAYARWAGKRLTTEAEWQWAAQNGERKDLYPWGEKYDAMRCNRGQTGGSTSVKKFKSGRTMSGLYDMSGNVWQMTESERTDGSNRYFIVRGGSWYVTRGSGWYADQGPQETGMGAKYLFIWPGLDRCATVGFRCVVDLQQ